MKQYKKLTYALKQKLSKKDKNPEDYRIKEYKGSDVVLINIKTQEELVIPNNLL